MGAEVEPLLAEIQESFSGPGGGELLELLRSCYSPQNTYGSAFGRLFAKLFSPLGLILLDPLDPKIHALGAPILHAALERRDELNEALLLP